MKRKTLFVLMAMLLSSCSGFSFVQPTATSTPSPTFTATITPTATPTALPTLTSTPAPTSTPSDVTKYGLLSLHVVPSHRELHGHGNWPLNTEVTLTVDDDNNASNGILYTAKKSLGDNPSCGNPCFDLRGKFQLKIGQYVTFTYGDHLTKTVHISRLRITSISIKKDTISGIADPGSRIAVNIWSQNGKARYVTADAQGNWIADFSVPGDEDFEQFTTNITYGDNGRAIQLNADGSDDGTLEYWSVN